MVTLDEIKKTVKEALVSACGKVKDDLKDADSLTTSLLLDANDIKLFVDELEKEFDIVLNDEEIAESNTVSDISKLVYSTINKTK